jgi:hypothetical protein
LGNYGFENDNCRIGQDGEELGFNSQLGQQGFLFSTFIQTLSGAHPLSYQMNIGERPLGVKVPGHGADY